MIHPTFGLPDPPPDAHPAGTKSELTLQQRTVLERLISRLTTLTSQQHTEIWAGIKHDLGLKGNAPLLAHHFTAAKNNLNQRFIVAQQHQQHRQTMAQVSELLNQGNNRQAVSDYIRQHYGQTMLHALTPQQLHHLLQILQNDPLSMPASPPHLSTPRPLLPAEYQALNQQVTRLAVATGGSGKQIWQSMLALCGVKSEKLIPASHFTPLSDWLHARQTLATQTAPTLLSLHAALKPPPDSGEWQKIADFASAHWHATPQTTLSITQIETLLNTLFASQVSGVHSLPPLTPAPPWQWQKYWRIWLALILLLGLLWLVKDY
ncbi:flagella biosynthesis regulator Flk [Enterobacteriaceae bacterium ESL0689]|nr:flagella biosynthesis regulator Flk [Enterobacteriaceae bacterium ESL0689]